MNALNKEPVTVLTPATLLFITITITMSRFLMPDPEDLRTVVLFSVPPQATVLEEMPPFPERESSILAKLKRKKGPRNLPDIDDVRRSVNGGAELSENPEATKQVRALQLQLQGPAGQGQNISPVAQRMETRINSMWVEVAGSQRITMIV